MKTDLATLKKEFKRLTDVEELKKELNRLAAEIRAFDLTTAIPAAQRDRLEKRYRELRATLADLQKRVDASFVKVSSFIRRAGQPRRATAKKTSRKKASSGSGRKKVSKKVRQAK